MTKPYTLSQLGEDLACLHLMDPHTPKGSAEVLDAIAETRADYRGNLAAARRAYPVAAVIGHVAALWGQSLLYMSTASPLAGRAAVAQRDAIDRDMANTQAALDKSIADLQHRREAAYLLNTLRRETRRLEGTAIGVQQIDCYLKRPPYLYASYDSIAIGGGLSL